MEHDLTVGDAVTILRRSDPVPDAMDGRVVRAIAHNLTVRPGTVREWVVGQNVIVLREYDRNTLAGPATLTGFDLGNPQFHVDRRWRVVNRREHERHAFYVPVSLHVPGQSRPIAGLDLDLSRGGMRIRTGRRPTPKDSRLRLDIHAPTGTLTATHHAGGASPEDPRLSRDS